MRIDCPICTRLRDKESSIYKYAAPEYDIPLPEAARLLLTIPEVTGEIPESHQVRCCPDCRQLYFYDTSYEYLVNGSEDEEVLTRMTSAQEDEYIKKRVIAVEKIRREIDGFRSASGSMSDYIDHGNPSPDDEKEAYANMEQYSLMANELNEKFTVHVEFLRTNLPIILSTLADAHIAVCLNLRDSLKDDMDGKVSTFVANETITAWEAFKAGTQSFVSINDYWLNGYNELIDGILGLTD